MTTATEWKDREEYLRAAAKRLKDHAAELVAEAGRLERLANQCDREAITMELSNQLRTK